MSTGLMVAGGLAAYALVVYLIVGAISVGTDRGLADIDAPIGLIPADDLMGVADAVQDDRPPLFVDEYLAARDIALFEMEMPIRLQDPALRGETE